MCPACQPVLERNLDLLLYRLKERFLESLVSSRFPIGTVESLVNWNHWTPLEILFARAEGLHAHGHSAEACELGIQLATELLANPPDLLVELPHVVTKSGNKKKTNPACHQISCLASATLAKCAFSARFWQRIQIFTTSPSELENNVWIGTGSTTSHYKAIRSQTGSSRVRVGDAVEENSSG